MMNNNMGMQQNINNFNQNQIGNNFLNQNINQNQIFINNMSTESDNKSTDESAV